MHLNHEQEVKAVNDCIDALRRCQELSRTPGGDASDGHQNADDVLLAFLRKLGYHGIIKEYEDVLRLAF